MLYQDKYEIEPKYMMPDGVTIKWNVTGSGESAIGVFGGKRYFLKRNNTILFPDKAKLAKIFANEEMLRAALEKKEKPFKELRDKQKEMMKLMASIDFDRDHVAREIDNFRDHENHFVTVTPVVENGVDRTDFDYTSINKDKFLDLARQMAKEIALIHKVGVIHSDIKMDNFVFANKTTPYLIDFDISFPAAKVPPEGGVGGTEGHMSPEVLSYRADPTPAMAANITPKIDVFSFAITLHYLWTRELPPTTDGKSVGEVLLEGKPFRLNSKFDFEIPGKGVKFSDLLKAMLQMAPTARPTADLVCKVLNGECGLTAEEPVPVPETVPVPGPVPVPETVPVPGPIHTPVPETIPTPISVPAPPVPEVCDPWPEDRIKLVTASELAAKGYLKIKRGIREGSYVLTYASGLVMAQSKNSLISLGLAQKSGEPLSDSRLWPEDVAAGYEIDEAVVRRMAIKEIKQTEGIDGSHNYTLVYVARSQVVSSKLFALMGIMKK